MAFYGESDFAKPINCQYIYEKYMRPSTRGSHLSMVRLKIKSKSWTILEGSFPITIIGFHIKLKISLIRYFSFVFNLYHFCLKSLNVDKFLDSKNVDQLVDILREKRHPMKKSEPENWPMLSFNVRFTLNPNWKLILFENNSVNPKIEFILANL